MMWNKWTFFPIKMRVFVNVRPILLSQRPKKTSEMDGLPFFSFAHWVKYPRKSRTTFWPKRLELTFYLKNFNWIFFIGFRHYWRPNFYSFYPMCKHFFQELFIPQLFYPCFISLLLPVWKYTVTGYDLKMSKKILFFFIVMLLARKLKRSRCKIQCRYKCFPCQ